MASTSMLGALNPLNPILRQQFAVVVEIDKSSDTAARVLHAIMLAVQISVNMTSIMQGSLDKSWIDNGLGHTKSNNNRGS